MKAMLWIALILFALTLVFAPWHTRGGAKTFIEMAPIWAAPDSYGESPRLGLGILFAEWVGIVVLYFGVKAARK